VKILIGTPIHRVKDYAVKRWLDCVRNLDYDNFELMLVDNSPDLEYQEYLKSIIPGSIKYSLVHVDINYTDPEERVAMAREEIRRQVLDNDFVFWFSWECDVMAPPDVLKKMLKYTDEFKVVHHLSPDRIDPENSIDNSFGLSLIHRDVLEKFPFAFQWGRIDTAIPARWCGTDSWFNKRIIKEGGTFIQLAGVVRPLKHLNE
jgi:hypothetical protein